MSERVPNKPTQTANTLSLAGNELWANNLLKQVKQTNTTARSSVHFPNPYIINLGTSVSKCHRFRRMDGSGCDCESVCVCVCVELAEELSKYLVDEVFRHKLCRFVPLRPWPEKEAVWGCVSWGKGWISHRGEPFMMYFRERMAHALNNGRAPQWPTCMSVCVCVFVISETIIIF